MILDDLIRKLQHVRGEVGGQIHVLVTGFDSWGFDDLERIGAVTVKRLAEKTPHGPTYEEPDQSHTNFTGPKITALHLY